MYLYTTEADERFFTAIMPERETRFPDRDGKLRMTISPSGAVMIAAGYAWDGCTPKFQCCGRVFGAWDGEIMADGRPQAWRASLLHDALYQFSYRRAYTREQADIEFFHLLTEAKFKLASQYYSAVRLFGWVWWS